MVSMMHNFRRRLDEYRWKLPPKFRPKPRQAAGIKARLQELPRVINQLQDFAQLSDREFTGLLQSLAQMQSTVGPLRERTEVILHLLEEKDEEQAVVCVHHTFRHCIDLIHSSLGIATSQQDYMKAVETALAQAISWKEEFRQNSMYLRIVEMGMRVETARIRSEHREVFSTVASAIEEIVRRMERCVEQAFARIDQVMTMARRERLDQDGLVVALEKSSQASIQTIEADLNNLRGRFPLHRKVCALLLEDFTRLENTFGQLLFAAQYQDIVRQKLEHVCAGFAEMQTADGPGRDAFLHSCAKVQSGQLVSARMEIEQAGQALTTHCRQLIPLAEEMVSQFQQLQEGVQETLASSGSTGSFLQQVEHLSSATKQTEISNERFDRLTSDISNTLEDFRREICELQIEVKRVAINAQLASVRIESVDALNKLAEEAAMLAVKNNATTRQLFTALSDAQQSMEKIQAQSRQFVAIVEREKSELLCRAAESQQKLDRMFSCLRTATAQTRETFQMVRDRMQQLLENLTFPEKIPEVFAPSAALCREIESLVSPDHQDRGADLLRAHQARYTMKSENVVHTRALAVSGTLAAACETQDQSSDVEPTLFVDLPSQGAAPPVQEGSASQDVSNTAGTASPPATSSPTTAANAEDDGIELF